MRKEFQPSYFKEKWEGAKAKGREIVRKLADVPEYLAIGTGIILLPFAALQPALIPVSLNLIIGGGVSYVVTEQAFPKKRFEAKKI